MAARLLHRGRIRHEMGLVPAVSVACQLRVSSGSGSRGTIGGVNPLAHRTADPALSPSQNSSRRRVTSRAPNRPLCSGRQSPHFRQASEPAWQPSRANERN